MWSHWASRTGEIFRWPLFGMGFCQSWRDVWMGCPLGRPLPNFRASCGFRRACRAPNPNQGDNLTWIACEAALEYFILLYSRPNRSLLEQATSLKKPRRQQDGRRLPACSLSFHCILNKRHLEVCAYPNTYACKSKAHKHLFKAALTYRVFKLFTAAACETYQNVHIFFPKILFRAPFSMIWCAS